MITPVNIGAAPNDKTGDSLRDAFAKCNKPIAGYDAALHAWVDADWQAAMADFVTAATLSAYYDDELALGNAVSSGTVTGLALPWVPVRVVAAVRVPAGGLKLVANVVDATLSADGFQFVLSAATDSANYKLDFLILQTRTGVLPLGPGSIAPSVGGISPSGPSGH